MSEYKHPVGTDLVEMLCKFYDEFPAAYDYPEMIFDQREYKITLKDEDTRGTAIFHYKNDEWAMD